MRIPIETEEKEVKGVRAHIPAWLTDPDGVAPCYCGRPLQMGEPHIVATGENGLRRWFHAVCWEMVMDDDDDEDYEEYE